MKEEALCLLCSKPPAFVQAIIGIDVESGDPSQCQVYACQTCKDELVRAMRQEGRKHGVIAAFWAVSMLTLILINPHWALLGFLPLVTVISIGTVVLTPAAARRAAKRIAEMGGRQGLRPQALGDIWLALETDFSNTSCSRCHATSTTHQCEIEGLTYAKTDHLVVIEKNVYATLRCPVPLCTPCATHLQRLLTSTRRLRFGGAVLVPATMAWMIFDSRGASLTSTTGSVSIEFIESFVVFLILFGISHLALGLFVRRFLELPWIAQTDAYRQLCAEGCGRTQVNIVSRPAPAPAQ